MWLNNTKYTKINLSIFLQWLAILMKEFAGEMNKCRFCMIQKLIKVVESLGKPTFFAGQSINN